MDAVYNYCTESNETERLLSSNRMHMKNENIFMIFSAEGIREVGTQDERDW